MKNNRSKNLVYEVEVSNTQNQEEFALELFELMEDATTKTSHRSIRNFDELLDWNEEFESGEK
ncbi:hypothetical protein [Bacillus pinisoli]|uniref:hypothetical protein n=1 Tax=Bacillus pinisoli TaxID=2901866 RepID=UPI001FF4D59A|nr:hypothetical protein [Bacillus pinisoli]